MLRYARILWKPTKSSECLVHQVVRTMTSSHRPSLRHVNEQAHAGQRPQPLESIATPDGLLHSSESQLKIHCGLVDLIRPSLPSRREQEAEQRRRELWAPAGRSVKSRLVARPLGATSLPFTWHGLGGRTFSRCQGSKPTAFSRGSRTVCEARFPRPTCTCKPRVLLAVEGMPVHDAKKQQTKGRKQQPNDMHLQTELTENKSEWPQHAVTGNLSGPAIVATRPVSYVICRMTWLFWSAT